MARTVGMDEEDASLALYQLSDYLCRYYGKKVLIFLDEYDTPMQEAYVNGYWDELGRTGKEKVKAWYDGFTFGDVTDIYNPWSIINFLDTGKFETYWANTSANSLAGKLIWEGSTGVKQKFEILLEGKTIRSEIDEQIVYNQLDQREDAIWGLLLASGDLKAMNGYMNRVALSTFSYFDTGERPSGAEPERFYHGFLLGLLVELSRSVFVSMGLRLRGKRC